MHCADALQQGRVGGDTGRGRTVQPSAIASPGHAEHTSHGGNEETGLVRAHESEEPDGIVPVFRANQAAAFERMSRSTVSCLFSRRSRTSSSRSAAARLRTASSRRPSWRLALGSPGADRLGGRLELAGKLVGTATGTHQVGHLAAELRRIGSTRSGHQEHLWRKLQRVHQTGSIPLIPVRHGVRCRSRSAGGGARRPVRCGLSPQQAFLPTCLPGRRNAFRPSSRPCCSCSPALLPLQRPALPFPLLRQPG